MAGITPIIGIISYLIIHLSAWDMNVENGSLIAICLLISAGSFLYVATMHVIPRIYINDQQFNR